MILIVDSGSTKTTWCVVGLDKSADTYITEGINPFLLGSDEILHLMESELTFPRTDISKIWFYGSGCGIADKNKMVHDVLSQFFKAPEIHVNSDLLATVHALCSKQPGIACILGTGSNACYFDGRDIIQFVPSLGYVLDDKGSGCALGKKLLTDIFKKQLPEDIRKIFFDTYNVTAGEILDNIYCKPFPNRYMAQFAKFIAAHVNYPEIRALANNCFREFFQRNIVQYEVAKKLPIHFTGSIAFHFCEILKETAGEFGLTVGKIMKEPMPGLIAYHIES